MKRLDKKLDNRLDFTYRFINVEDISSTGLQREAIAGCITDPLDDDYHGVIKPHGTTMMSLKITIYRDGESFPERADGVVIFVDGGYRIGLSWGADPEWGDVYTRAANNDDPAFIGAVEEAIDDWLNNCDAWEARN